MVLFKTGYRVKCINHQGLYSSGLRVGDKGSVCPLSEQKHGDMILVAFDNGQRWFMNPANIKKLRRKSKLQRLVDGVNAGKDALREILQKYPYETRYKNDVVGHRRIGPEQDCGDKFSIEHADDHIEVVAKQSKR